MEKVITDFEKTYPSLAEEFRQIQKGAVVEYNDLINASDLVNMKDKFQVLYFEQTYF